MSNRTETPVSLSTLSYVLRNKDLWPEGFTWEFTQCRHCAVGMAYRLFFKETIPASYSMARIMRDLQLDEETVEHLFVRAYGCAPRHITPEMIADRIDAHLKRKDLLDASNNASSLLPCS